MADGFSILTFLGSVKTAKETGILILDASKSRERAELEYKIASLTKTLTELENQAREFEKTIQEKDKEIEKLKGVINKRTVSEVDNLPNECLDILKLFADYSSLHPQEIAQILNISKQKTEFFLGSLKNERLITSFKDRLFTKFKLSEKGSKFLFDRNLL